MLTSLQAILCIIDVENCNKSSKYIINIIRLFLSDISLEILFDIISSSVFFYGYI